MTNVWIFTTNSGAAYDATQTNSDIRDGDVLIVPNEGVLGIMVKAWPVALTSEKGQFDGIRLNRPTLDDFRRIDSLREYRDSVERAISYLDEEVWGDHVIITLNRDMLELTAGYYHILSPIGLSERF